MTNIVLILLGRSALKPSHNSDEVAVATEAVENLSLSTDPAKDLVEWKETVFDIIRNIKDPEKEETLEELDVVRESLVSVNRNSPESTFYSVRVEFVPTVPHCSLATLIGLCLITKLNRELPSGIDNGQHCCYISFCLDVRIFLNFFLRLTAGRFKIDLAIAEGTHSTGPEITKQINDKERVAAALENPNLRKTVEECIDYQN